MADYMPGTDADFNAWQANFVSYANANQVALGLEAADITALTTAQTDWSTDFTAHIAAKAAARGAAQSKDEARAGFVDVIRPLVRRLQASPTITDAERAGLGITIEKIPTPVGTPKTAPLVSVESGNRLQHTLRFVDSATPTRKAKPAGVMGVEIWAKVGDEPPAGEEELKFIAVDTSAPYTLNFTSAEANKNAYYWLRWVSATGERGPWSEQAAATIAA